MASKLLTACFPDFNSPAPLIFFVHPYPMGVLNILLSPLRILVFHISVSLGVFLFFLNPLPSLQVKLITPSLSLL